MKPIIFLHIKPVHPLLAAFVLLAIAMIFFFWGHPLPAENSGHETSEGAGAFHSLLICI